jgi:nitroimidazol reductase NimA-like FMN-containing flavoprotein (pyridoxamine 5'-phosphate oxidase superfamily)
MLRPAASVIFEAQVPSALLVAAELWCAQGPCAADGIDGDGVMEDTNDAVVSLSEEQCWNLLARGELGHLALDADGDPDIFPVNYVIDGPRVFFRTAPGSKLAELTQHPRVAFEVDEYDDTHASSVIVKGVAERLEVQREIDEADALPLTPWIPTLKYRWVRIVPTQVTGRWFARAPEPARYRASEKEGA